MEQIWIWMLPGSIGFYHRHGCRRDWKLLGILENYVNKKKYKLKIFERNEIEIINGLDGCGTISNNIYQKCIIAKRIVDKIQIICVLDWAPSTVVNTPLVGGSYIYMLWSWQNPPYRLVCFKSINNVWCVWSESQNDDIAIRKCYLFTVWEMFANWSRDPLVVEYWKPNGRVCTRSRVYMHSMCACVECMCFKYMYCVWNWSI